MDNLQKIDAALKEQCKKDGDGLKKALAEVVLDVAGKNAHNAEVIAADLDGKDDVLDKISEKAWEWARKHQSQNGCYMGQKNALEVVCAFFAIPTTEEEETSAPAEPAAPTVAAPKVIKLTDFL